MVPFAGEDFQMFEKDLPGENKSGLSYQQPSQKLPLETCETINNSWGFNITDTTYKSTKQLVDYLVKANGSGANFLLNIGPMPNGEVQPEFKQRLDSIGKWIAVYGESIYNTKGGYMKPQSWGAITQKDGKMYVHLLKKDVSSVTLDNFPYKKITNAYLLKDKTKVQTTLKNGTVTITPPVTNNNEPDEVTVLETKS